MAYVATTPTLKNGDSLDILIDGHAGTWSIGEWDGDEKVLCQVKRHDKRIPNATEEERYTISCLCYYDHRGEFSMCITQPLERSIDTFMAALKADAEFG